MAQPLNTNNVKKETAKGAAIGAGVGVATGVSIGIGIGAAAATAAKGAVIGTVAGALTIGTAVISAPVVIPAVIGTAVVGGLGALIANVVAKNKALDLQAKANEKQGKSIQLTGKKTALNSLQQEKKEQESKMETLSKSMEQTKQNMLSQENEFKQANEVHGYSSHPSQIMVMIGKTNHGKSTLGNRICGDTSKRGEEGPFKTSASKDKACTGKPQSILTMNGFTDEGQNTGTGTAVSDSDNDDADEEIVISNKQTLLVIDTPGWCDVEQKNDDHHKNLVIRYLRGSGGINAFVMVVSNADRIDGSIQQMLKEYETLFDVQFWDHLIIVVTRVDDEDDLKYFEDEKSAWQIQKILKQKFEHLIVDIPVIPIGKKIYGQQIKLILDKIPKNKFTCNALQGPYELLKEKYEGMINTFEGMNDKLDQLDIDIIKTKQDIQSLKQSIEKLSAEM